MNENIFTLEATKLCFVHSTAQDALFPAAWREEHPPLLQWGPHNVKNKTTSKCWAEEFITT